MGSENNSENSRRRIVEWEDPIASAKAIRGLSGREVFEKLLAGELPPPPIMKLVGQTLDEVGEGRIVMSLEPGEHQYNPIGMVHGGVIATILDSVMGCAIHTVLPRGKGYSTLELKVNYIRAVTLATGKVRAEGKTVHVGRRSAVAEGKLFDAAGKLYATATTTCIVFDPDEKG